MPHARTASRALVVVTNYMERGHPGRPVARTPVAGTRLRVICASISSPNGVPCHARRERVSATLVSKAAHSNSNIEPVPLLLM